MSQLSPIYWLKARERPLMVVVAANPSRAAKLFGVTNQTVNRSGGVWSAENSECPPEVSFAVGEARQNSGAVLSLIDGHWLITQKASVAQELDQQVRDNIKRRGSWTAGGARMPTRIIRFTKAEAEQFQAAGSGEWFRRVVNEASLEGAVKASRRRLDEEMVTVGVRTSDSTWERFQALGGITWLRGKLPKLD